MSLTYGFYNSMNNDRKYNAEQFSSIFEGIINDGVFMSIGDNLIVTSGSGMNVNVGTGRAWFNKTWTDNDSILPLTVDQAEITLYRFDTVVIEINNSNEVRANSIKILKGIPSSFETAAPPQLLHSELVHQYPLAHICVQPGATSISQSIIMNTVGTSECPFITGILETVNTDSLLQQWESEFNIWFESIKDVFTGNTEANIIGMIDTHSGDHSKHTDYAIATGSANNYVVTLSPAITAYSEGMAICVKINVESTGNSTININNLGPKTIKDSLGNPISSGGLKAGIPYTLRYNGSVFIVQGKGGGGTATADKILAPYTATNDNGQVTGTMPYNYGEFMVYAESGHENYVVIEPPVGYSDSQTRLWLLGVDYKSNNIVSTANIFGLQGTATIASLGGKRFATGFVPVASDGSYIVSLGWRPSKFIISTKTITPLAVTAGDYDNGAIVYPERQFMKVEPSYAEFSSFNTGGGALTVNGGVCSISSGYSSNGITFSAYIYSTYVTGILPIIGTYQYLFGGGATRTWRFFNQAVYYAWE